ncbi:hypothetical protein U9M48_042711, partial [Paspalum notatum var. saurae]
SHRIEVPRIADFTNPSAGSMMWRGLPVEDGVFWSHYQAGRLGVGVGQPGPLVNIVT